MCIQRLFCLSLISLLFACQEKSEIQSPNQIVLIFKDAPDNTKHTFHNGWTVHGKGRGKAISYFDDEGFKHFEELNHQGYDTIIIKSARNKVEVTHAYRGIEKLCYVFQLGDTALFTYKEQKPEVSIHNRDFSNLVLNYDIYRKEQLDEGDFSDYAMFFNPWLDKGFDFKVENIAKEADSVQKIAQSRASEKLDKEIVLLDSMRQQGLLTDEEVSYFTKRSMIELKIMTLQQELEFRPLEKLSRELNPSDLNLSSGISMELEKQLTDLDIGNGDSDIYYSHHEELLDWMLYNYFSRKVGRVSSTIYHEGQPGAGSNMPNYAELYDTIQNAQLLSKIDRNVLLFKTMENLIENSSLDQRAMYFEKFKVDTQDSAMTNFLALKYQLDKPDGAAMLLVSAIGDTVEYDDLIKHFKGKVIYIDFWASGCGPCLKEQPYAVKLEEKYRDSNLIFINVSIDSEPDRWLSSIEKRNRSERANEFILINKYTSRQFDEMNLEYIPRYIVYDNEGELVETYAPRPSDDKLLSLLNRYLAKVN